MYYPKSDEAELSQMNDMYQGMGQAIWGYGEMTAGTDDEFMQTMKEMGIPMGPDV